MCIRDRCKMASKYGRKNSFVCKQTKFNKSKKNNKSYITHTTENHSPTAWNRILINSVIAVNILIFSDILISHPKNLCYFNNFTVLLHRDFIGKVTTH